MNKCLKEVTKLFGKTRDYEVISFYVKCLDGQQCTLTNGRFYRVVGVLKRKEGTFVSVVDDNGICSTFRMSRFDMTTADCCDFDA